MSIQSNTKEIALEQTIERSLTGGYNQEELNTDHIAHNDPLLYGKSNYLIGMPTSYDKALAIDKEYFWQFLEETQEDELEKLKKRHTNWKAALLHRYHLLVKRHGILYLLKKGLQYEDVHFTLFYQPPLASSSEQIKQDFYKNIFSITRQLTYSEANPGEEIDVVLFINGMPIVTMELKNPWTGQNARFHGIRQYQYDRDTTQTLFNFGRCLVHFAVDTDEVYMTTRLNGDKTFFLPFNKGCNNGEGNPVNPNGHKTAYLWEEILTKESLANLVQHFIRFDGKDKDPLDKRTLFFPRYHQLDVVRKMIDDVQRRGAGQTYLIQHSAGSGKSNSITWAAFQLIDATPLTKESAKGKNLNSPIFDSVIVVTDRRLLDRQIRDNIHNFTEVKNIVAHAETANELRKHIESGKRIIITTIQKFPFMVAEIDDMSNRKFALLIDEAHSSQSGAAADAMNRAMGQAEWANEAVSAMETLQQMMKARKMCNNASYFAFTATPKRATLERFGEKQPDGKFRPFHLYSMKQAIQEGFILDVLANYTTYKSYYKIQKSIEDNPLFDNKKAQKKLKRAVEMNPTTINMKAEIMFEHFFESVFRPKLLKGKAKAMVVTQDIESAIRYYFAFKKLLKKAYNPFKILIAFSGTKTVDGVEYTEAGINGFPEGETREVFDEDDYRILIVANKYLTGFDQPKLTAMYVDKRLQDVMAVQALSRLNRSANRLGKKTEDLFVLDFFNTEDEIRNSFQQFYTSTALEKATDVNVLHDLYEQIYQEEVFTTEEVDAFVELFFSGADAQQLSPIIDTAAQRFNHTLEWEDKDKADFKIKVKHFVKVYGQMAALLPYDILNWEKLFWFTKFLVPKLIVRTQEDDDLDAILNSVDLSTYGLQRVKLNSSIQLASEDSVLDAVSANPRGAHASEEEKDPLTAIVETFNDRWFGDLSDLEGTEIRLVNLVKQVKASEEYQNTFLNTSDPEGKEIVFNQLMKHAIFENRKKDIEWSKRINNDPDFKASVYSAARQILDAGVL